MSPHGLILQECKEVTGYAAQAEWSSLGATGSGAAAASEKCC